MKTLKTLIALWLAAAGATSHADNYPSKPITMIVLRRSIPLKHAR